MWFRDFIRLAGWFPGLSVAAIGFSLAAALLEGLGLAALIPVLQTSVGGASLSVPLVRWLPAEPERRVLFGVITFLVLAGSASVSRFMADMLLLRLRTSVESTARRRLGHALLHMSWPAFLSLKLGDIAKAQIIEGTEMGAGTHIFIHALGAALASLAYLCVALYISVPMTLYTLAFGIGIALLYLALGRWARRHADELSRIASSVGERVTDIFHGLKFIRATGMTTKAEGEAESLFEAWRRSYFASQLYPIGLRQGFEILGLVFIAAFLLVSLGSGADALPSALVFLAVFYRLAPRLLAAQDGFYYARTYHSWYVTWNERLRLAQAAAEKRPASSKAPSRFALELRNVSYRYPGAEQYALERISLTIPPGGSIAIVGASGAGKSTLLDLITGLLEPTAGALLVDGRDMRAIDLQELRTRIGLVQQEPFLVHGTVLENIAWGDDHVDVARAADAARKAGASQFIEALPHGMQTVLGERGGRLSGGQRQRIALARALYRRPALLILDEPTSALDRESQAEVLAALAAAKRQCTLIIVTHSTEVAALCEATITIEEGRAKPLKCSDSLPSVGRGRPTRDTESQR